MSRLRTRVKKFRSDAFPQRAERFAALAEVQRPHVMFITCSDSRIDPAMLLQAEPGEIFMVRNPGNLVSPAGGDPTGETAAVEFAMRTLEIRDLIVCGHSNCGALQAVLNPETAAGLPHVRGWTSRAAERGEDGIDGLIQRNVIRQLEHLRTHEFVREQEASGRLTLHGWVYRIGTGEIMALDPGSGRFAPLG